MVTSGNGCITSAHQPPVAMETGSKSNNGEAAALLWTFKSVLKRLRGVNVQVNKFTNPYVCVSVRGFTNACACWNAHLCCGRGYRCWNLRSRWRLAQQEDCSSPSHHRNTITMATIEGKIQGRGWVCSKCHLFTRSNASSITKHLINRWLYTREIPTPNKTHCRQQRALKDYFQFGSVTLAAWRVGARIIIFC